MPSKSPAQARLMAAAAHNPEFAAKVGVPMKVASEFNEADAGTQRLRDALKRNRRQAGPRPPPQLP